MPIGKLNNVMLYLSDEALDASFSGGRKIDHLFFGCVLSSGLVEHTESTHSAFHSQSYASVFVNRGDRLESRLLALIVAFFVYF